MIATLEEKHIDFFEVRPNSYGLVQKPDSLYLYLPNTLVNQGISQLIYLGGPHLVPVYQPISPPSGVSGATLNNTWQWRTTRELQESIILLKHMMILKHSHRHT